MDDRCDAMLLHCYMDKTLNYIGKLVSKLVCTIKPFTQAKSAASFCRQVAARVPDS